MAQSLHGVEAIVKSSYGLQVAVRCTPSATNLCRKNQLTFCELLEPFSQLNSPGLCPSDTLRQRRASQCAE